MAQDSTERVALRLRGAEIGVALVILLLGVLIVFDSLRIGARWAEDGPQTGYFPFYIALILCVACLANIVFALSLKREANQPFVRVGQLKLVLAVLIPSSLFVAVIPWTGLYVAAVLFIAYFMRRLGSYPWWKAAATSATTGVTLFLLFEVWFLVPLPKGPLERVLGLG